MSMLARLLKPSLSDFIFVAILLWMFAFAPNGFSRLLADGDTGWHIRAGQWMLEHGAVPTRDLFSYSKPDAPWFAWEWATDVLYAVLYSLAGLKAITLFAAVQVALFAALLLRLTIARGASPGFAIITTFLAIGACTIHYYARPHLATLLFVPVFAWILDRDKLKPDRALWLLVPLTALWTNLHGGFLAGLAMIGLYCAGSAIEAVWHRASGPIHWTAPRRYLLVGAASGLATFANPYGYHLHQHLSAYMSSSWIQSAISEFQAPTFRGENELQFEFLLLAGLMAAAFALARAAVSPALLLLFWAHQSLHSARHLTIFSTLAAPWIAVEATHLWRRLAAGAPRKSTIAVLDQLANDSVARFRHTSLWPAAVVALVAFLPLASIQWPTDFPAAQFPTALIATHAGRIQSAERLLTEDQWADYLIYRHYPTQRVYFDGRSDFYGETIGREYRNLMDARPGWRETLDRRAFDLALIPRQWALVSLLQHDPAWRLIASDNKALLFERVGRINIAVAKR